MPRFSTASAVSALLAAVAYVRADLAFTDHLKTTERNLSLVAEMLELLPSSVDEVAFAPAPSLAIDELSIFWFLIALSIALSVATVVLAWGAKRRGEPSLRWAWPVLVAYAVAVFVVRLLGWSASITTM